MNLREGDHFDHYQICAHIAQGGTGDVYRVRDVLSGRQVALKIPKRSVIMDAALYEQFLRELDAMRVLCHPAVQCGLDSGRSHDTPFLVTDWVEGKSLHSLLKEMGSFPVDRAIRLISRIADGLIYCHQLAIVHRDLKPENILIKNDDQPVILDFGLALTPERPGAGKPAGTPDYVAPEQIEGQRGDQRIDIYSLGAVFYEMLAGEPPYVGKDAADVIRMHLHEAVPRLDQVRPGISQELATVVARCLQRVPDQRYSDLQAFIGDLEHLDHVDTQDLNALTAVPPKPPFFKTQAGQVVLMLTAFVVGSTLLTLVAVALKH